MVAIKNRMNLYACKCWVWGRKSGIRWVFFHLKRERVSNKNDCCDSNTCFVISVTMANRKCYALLAVPMKMENTIREFYQMNFHEKRSKNTPRLHIAHGTSTDCYHHLNLNFPST